VTPIAEQAPHRKLATPPDNLAHLKRAQQRLTRPADERFKFPEGPHVPRDNTRVGDIRSAPATCSDGGWNRSNRSTEAFAQSGRQRGGYKPRFESGRAQNQRARKRPNST